MSVYADVPTQRGTENRGECKSSVDSHGDRTERKTGLT